MKKRILLGHGSGGRLTHDLINNLLLKKFGNPVLNQLKDSGIFNAGNARLAFTTDSYVVNPIVFPGGDIGKLAVCGTVNDLAVCGGKPLFISCALIIEEGLEVSLLEKLLESIKRTSKEAGVKIITGDTKVVEKGSCDRIFINTSGVGIIERGVNLSINNIKAGDDIIINGTIGDHGISVLSKREGIEFLSTVKSDCCVLNDIISKVLKTTKDVKFMRDPTRGGVASTLNEIVENKKFGIILDEESLPVKKSVKSACELLGIDPLYMGNEGKVIIISPPGATKRILNTLKRHKLGRESRIIGKVTGKYRGRVSIKTKSGGVRLVDMLTGDQLPRIC